MYSSASSVTTLTPDLRIRSSILTFEIKVGILILPTFSSFSETVIIFSFSFYCTECFV